MCSYTEGQLYESVELRIEEIESEALRAVARKVLARKGPELADRLLDLHDRFAGIEGPPPSREGLLELGFEEDEITAAESGYSA